MQHLGIERVGGNINMPHPLHTSHCKKSNYSHQTHPLSGLFHVPIALHTQPYTRNILLSVMTHDNFFVFFWEGWHKHTENFALVAKLTYVQPYPFCSVISTWIKDQIRNYTMYKFKLVSNNARPVNLSPSWQKKSDVILLADICRGALEVLAR